MRGLGPPKKLWNSWNIDLIAEYHNLIPRLSLLKVAGEGKPGNEIESSIAILILARVWKFLGSVPRTRFFLKSGSRATFQVRSAKLPGPSF